MKFLFLLFSLCCVFTFFSGCNNSKSGGSAPVPAKSVEELKKEVLSKACNEEIKQDYENEFAKTSKLSEDQQKRRLQAMSKNIKCE